MWSGIKDWDKPSAENAVRCRSFEAASYEFNGIEMPYRYFEAKTGEKVPVVLFLHGADVTGRDNLQQLSMHDIGTIFADPAWQKKEPCHILAPQYDNGTHWAAGNTGRWLQSLVGDHLRRHENADRDRIYIYGYSAGAIGALELLKKYPGFYAAAVLICGSTGTEGLEELKKIPLWLYHADDDMIVNSGIHRGMWKEEYLGSAALYERLKALGAEDIHLTSFEPGEMMRRYGLHAHCSWVPAGKDVKMWKWLFSHRRDRDELA